MLKEINIHQAVDACTKEAEVRPVYKLVPITLGDSIRELASYRLAVEEADEKPQKPQKTQKEPGRKIDHGKIMALHRAKLTPSRIAEEIGCSLQTVINHIKQEEGQ